MNPITKFFHELMNPHCPHCMQLEEIKIEETKYCKTCEVLQMELARANTRIDALLTKPVATTDALVGNEVKQNIIQTRHVPWHIKQQQLEEESRVRANALRKAAIPDVVTDIVNNPILKSVDILENELGISNARSS